MTNVSQTITPGPERRAAGPIVWAATLLIVILCVGTNVNTLVDSLRALPGSGTIGGLFVLQYDSTRTAIVQDVVPGLPLAQAGVRNGDRVRLDPTFDYRRLPATGVALGLTIVSDRIPRHVLVTVSARAPGDLAHQIRLNVIDVISALCSTLVALLIVWRSERRLSLLALGLFFALANVTLHNFHPNATGQTLVDIVGIVTTAGGLTMSIAFAILFQTENVGSTRRWMWRATAAYGVVLTLLLVAQEFYMVTGEPVLPYPAMIAALTVLGQAGATAGLVYGWMRSTREARRRYLVMLAGVGCMVSSTLILGVFDNMLGVKLFDSPLLWEYEILATLAPILFAYAVLRHRVVDLGFVVNRTLVYAVISFALLVTFGLIEWASERFLPHETLEASALINAGVALAIYLVFHRLRDWVEAAVERLLFSSWRRNEAALRRFVRQAGFIARPEALTQAAVAEFRRFSGGADCAIYSQAGADFARLDGMVPGLAETIDGDDASVVAMRSDHHPIERGGLAALALPMVHRADLGGFILLGERPSGDDYRPDQVEVLAWAAQQLGFDIRALEATRLEAQAAHQAQEMLLLSARYDELRAALPVRPQKRARKTVAPAG